MQQIAGNRVEFSKNVLGVAPHIPCTSPSGRGYPYHTKFKFYFKDIQDLLPNLLEK